MLCSHWRLDLEDLQSKHDLIVDKINNNRNKLIELMNFIYKLHTNGVLNMTEPGHLDNETDLQQKLKKVKSELHNLSKLMQYEGGIY